MNDRRPSSRADRGHRFALVGALLAVCVLLFFLRDLRATLVVATAIPISVLLANSIVQDGHGMLPLLGESLLKIKPCRSSFSSSLTRLRAQRSI